MKFDYSVINCLPFGKSKLEIYCAFVNFINFKVLKLRNTTLRFLYVTEMERIKASLQKVKFFETCILYSF